MLKDTGIFWIGQIPNNWDINKVKYSTYVKGRVGWKGLKSDEFLKEGFALLVTGTDFNNGEINWENCYQIEKDRYDEDTYIQLKNNDLLITKDGTIGKIAIVNDLPKEACLNSGIFVTRPLYPNLYNTKYFYWILNSSVFNEFIKYNSSGTTINHLYQDTFIRFSYPFPEYDIQQKIATFLDEKCALIDQLIEKKQKLIELKKEERVAIINQAVTKGLDPNVPMKDSGIDWLGEIPEHWERLRIKNLVSIKVCDGPHETPEWKESGIPFISAEAIKDNRIDFNYKRGYISIEQHEEYCKKSRVNFGDILFCKSGSTTGKSAMVDTTEQFGIWSPLAIIRANANLVNNQYLFQSIQSDIFRTQVETSWTFGTQPNIGMSSLENLWIALPPIEEQLQIVKNLSLELSKIDLLILKIKNQIDLFQEYKTTLISDAVTGKINLK